MEQVDRLLRELQDGLSSVAPHLGPIVALPVLVLAAFVVVRRGLGAAFYLGRLVVVPAAVGVAGLVGLCVLTLDLLVAGAFRLLRRVPPAFAYAAGDLAAGGTLRVQRGIRWTVNRPGHRRELPAIVSRLVAVGLIWWWNGGYCDRGGGAGCRSPLAAWLHHIDTLIFDPWL